MGNTTSHMCNVALTTFTLLETGEYSDLTLVCQGTELRVHKGIICVQSPVIATALKSKFKEAETNIMEVDFDLTTLECMLQYMYTGNYKEEPAEHVRLQRVQSAESVQITSTNGKGEEKSVTTTVSEALVYHVRVNSIADYYGVIGLAQLSAKRIETLLNERWSSDTFCNRIEEAMGSTGDKNLREVIVHAAASNVSELVSKDIFSNGKVANDIAAEVLAISTKNHVKQKELEKELEDKVRAGKERIDCLEQNLNELADVLSTTHICPSWGCGRTSGFQIQRSSQNTEKRWFIFCHSCDSRYMWDKDNKRAVHVPSYPPQ
ncbi:hypothetical protein CHU98_g10073 [Xylaria longipes]|nr:hypothetical protein CHU98_g10073 [Xylaria longipes]